MVMWLAWDQPGQAGSPFHLLLGRAGSQDDFVKLMINLEDQFPRERGCVALQAYRMRADEFSANLGEGRRGR